MTYPWIPLRFQCLPGATFYEFCLAPLLSAAMQEEMADRIDQEKQRNANALQKQAQGQDGQKPEPQN